MSSTMEKVIENLEIKAKSLSSYVVMAATAGAAYWLDVMTIDDRIAFINAHHVLAPLLPYLTLITWLVAALFPQNITTASQRKQLVEDIKAKLLDLVSTVTVTVPVEAKAAPLTVSVTPVAAPPAGPVPPAPPPVLTQAVTEPEVDVPLQFEDTTLIEPNPPASAAQDVVNANLASVVRPDDMYDAARRLFPTLSDQEFRKLMATAITQLPAALAKRPRAPKQLSNPA